MKRFFSIFIILTALILTSCGGDITINIFTRDLRDVNSSVEEVIYATVNMNVKELEDENDINFLKENLNGFCNGVAKKGDYSTSYSFDMKVPVINEGTLLDFSKDLFVITGKKEDNKVNYYLQYNRELYKKIDDYIYNSHYVNVDLSSFSIQLNITNDRRSSTKFAAYSCYIDNNPYPFGYSTILHEGEVLHLKISDIFNEYISASENVEYPLFTIVE